MLSFLTYQRWGAHVHGLDAFPQDQWPDKIELLYFSYHVMVGLGTIFIAVMAVSVFLLWRKKLYESRWMLWILMLARAVAVHRKHRRMDDRRAGPPALADLWLAAHRARRFSARGAGNAWFTLLGFMGMYSLLSILWLFLIYREIECGPEPDKSQRAGADAPAAG